MNRSLSEILDEYITSKSDRQTIAEQFHVTATMVSHLRSGARTFNWRMVRTIARLTGLKGKDVIHALVENQDMLAVPLPLDNADWLDVIGALMDGDKDVISRMSIASRGKK